MRVKIAKWGNSAAIRLPKAVMEEMRLDEGGELDLQLVEGELRAVAVRSLPPPNAGSACSSNENVGRT